MMQNFQFPFPRKTVRRIHEITEKLPKTEAFRKPPELLKVKANLIKDKKVGL